MEIKSIFGVVAVAAVALSIVDRASLFAPHNSPYLARWMGNIFHCAAISLARPAVFAVVAHSVAFMLVFALEIKRIKRAPVTLFFRGNLLQSFSTAAAGFCFLWRLLANIEGQGKLAFHGDSLSLVARWAHCGSSAGRYRWPQRNDVKSAIDSSRRRGPSQSKEAAH